jgi:hypothetical protein
LSCFSTQDTKCTYFSLFLLLSATNIHGNYKKTVKGKWCKLTVVLRSKECHDGELTLVFFLPHMPSQLELKRLATENAMSSQK